MRSISNKKTRTKAVLIRRKFNFKKQPSGNYEGGTIHRIENRTESGEYILINTEDQIVVLDVAKDLPFVEFNSWSRFKDILRYTPGCNIHLHKMELCFGGTSYRLHINEALNVPILYKHSDGTFFSLFKKSCAYPDRMEIFASDVYMHFDEKDQQIIYIRKNGDEVSEFVPHCTFSGDIITIVLDCKPVRFDRKTNMEI